MGKPVFSTIDLFWRTANFVSVSLLYLRSNPMLLRPLTFEHIKPRVIGHWGCIPAINFIWANILAAVNTTNADVRLFLGTGHAGPAWLSCSYLEGSLSQYYKVGDDEESLTWLASSFGKNGGFSTEISAQYPGVFWPSGELGYALGIAHGHSLATSRSYAIAIIGDGELETAPTGTALKALKKYRAHLSRLIVIINFNGYRMGGVSEISTWKESEIKQYFSGLGLEPEFIDGFDTAALFTLLQKTLAEPTGHPSPLIIFLRTSKGATTPSLPDGREVVGTAAAHKVPINKIRTSQEVEWLENWLQSYKVERVFQHGKVNRGDFSAILPPTPRTLGTARDRILEIQPLSFTNTIRAKNTSLLSVFVDTLRSSVGNVLITSPDELSSNRLCGLAAGQFKVAEYLSEHQCLSWTIGAASAGHVSWYTSYDAFAPVIASMLAQHLKFLDSARQCNASLSLMPLNLLLTSLGWRNVYSHQEPGFASSMLEKHFHSFHCFLPVSKAGMEATVKLCSEKPNRVNCIIVDKYDTVWTAPPTRLSDGIPFSKLGIWGTRLKSATDICILVVGDYLLRESVFAAQVIMTASEHLTCHVIVLEELSWLYRDSMESQTQRSDLSEVISSSTLVFLVTSLYSDVVSSLIYPLLPSGCEYRAFGFRSNVTVTTALGNLFECQCSWIQMAANALDVVVNKAVIEFSDEALRIAKELRTLYQNIQEQLTYLYEDPDWYWTLEPEDLLDLKSKG